MSAFLINFYLKEFESLSFLNSPDIYTFEHVQESSCPSKSDGKVGIAMYLETAHNM